MLKKFFKNNIPLIVSEILIVVLFCLYHGRFGDVIVDSFREAYIPLQMLNGELLYKDIFCIYPPLAYIINSILLAIFGKTLKVLYFAGLFTTMGVFYLTYFIGRKFLDKQLLFSICLFLISAFVLSPNVFSPFFPYSFGMLYGIFFILSSIYFGLNKRFLLSYFFYSLAVLSKYEFVFLLPLLLYYGWKSNPWWKNIGALGSPFLAIILSLYKVGFASIVNQLDAITGMCATKTLYYFYAKSGLIYCPALLKLYVINIIKFLCPIYWNNYQEILIWAFPVISLIFFTRLWKKNLYRKEIFFVMATLLISVKMFFALLLQSYGVFVLPFALIALGILISQKWRNFYAILLLLWGIIVGGCHITTLLNKNYEIKTSVGIVKATPYKGQSLEELVQYFKSVPKNSEILVLPEGLVVNVLTETLSDNKIYSLLPLYIETFGEDAIINRLMTKKPDYIAISNYNTSGYYYRQFGQDYATQIMDWINQYYTLETTIEYGMSFSVYKLKCSSPIL
jgi:hypothetical protein